MYVRVIRYGEIADLYEVERVDGAALLVKHEWVLYYVDYAHKVAVAEYTRSERASARHKFKPVKSYESHRTHDVKDVPMTPAIREMLRQAFMKDLVVKTWPEIKA